MKPDAHRFSASVSHESAYQGLSPAAFVHRNRLRMLTGTLRALPLPGRGSLADFGCSDGFILQQLRRAGTLDASWSFHGFDHAEHFVERARARRVSGAEFEVFSLTTVSDKLAERFDLVLCLETLEHCGDFRNAVRNLEIACKPGGLVVITVPIEIGVPGVVKYFGRRAFRSGEYTRFFSERSEAKYIRALLSGGDLEDFRQPPRRGWPEHLGFDNRKLDRFLDEHFLAPAKLELLRRGRVGLGFGRIYVLQKPFD